MRDLTSVRLASAILPALSPSMQLSAQRFRAATGAKEEGWYDSRSVIGVGSRSSRGCAYRDLDASQPQDDRQMIQIQCEHPSLNQCEHPSLKRCEHPSLNRCEHPSLKQSCQVFI